MNNLMLQKTAGILFLVSALSFVVLGILALIRYNYLIELEVMDKAIHFFLILISFSIFFGLIGMLLIYINEISKYITPFLLIISLFLSATPYIAIGFIETSYIKGESNLNKISKLYNNIDEWEDRASIIREGILKGAELYPLPSKSTLNVTNHSIRIYDNYSVENIFLETIPGFFLAGNLYKPIGYEFSGPRPVILIPHGHFTDGRFEESQQHLGSTFARMGAIAMTYDMVGRGETLQVFHKFEYSLKLQLWNSIRVLDYLLSLDNTDPSNVGITGASGGGTQSFLLSAVDDRVDVCAPVVMVSSWMYGGCACESGMPIHKGYGYATNNAEIAALIAPKPLLLVSIGTDWTKHTPTLEYPFIQRIYEFYNKVDSVQNVHFPTEEHNYGFSKRNAVYSFFAEHLNLNITNVQFENGSINEEANTIETKNIMKSFTESYSIPDWALKTEEEVISSLKSLK